MAHSSATQERYYANELQNAEAEQAYEVINEIRVSRSNQLKSTNNWFKEFFWIPRNNYKGFNPFVCMTREHIVLLATKQLLVEDKLVVNTRFLQGNGGQ